MFKTFSDVSMQFCDVISVYDDVIPCARQVVSLIETNVTRNHDLVQRNVGMTQYSLIYL